MEKIRKPFQGVLNIIRFNWHFYLFALSLLVLGLLIARHLNEPFHSYLSALCNIAAFTTLLSLLVSFYIYDVSPLYSFKWLEVQNTENLIVNINAGFDETSALLKLKFKDAELVALDFYDPLKHTEISIKRARKAYPPFPGTKQVKTTSLSLQESSVDKVFVILAAHEIRNKQERTAFFKELNRIIKPTGEIYVIEHLRDPANFLAYTVGFFHFYSKTSWLKIFRGGGLKIKNEIKLTPFISTFVLSKNGNTL